MKPYEINGVPLMADDEGRGAFDVFNPLSATANDRGPRGMVEELKAFMRTTEHCKVLADIGALFGIFSLMFTRNPGTKAYAFEPSEMAHPFLLAHARANPAHNIVAMPFFIGRETGRKLDCGRDWKHVVANRAMTGGIVVHEEMCLDDLDLGDIDCMKIDVEGHEGSVLRGAEHTITSRRPLIFLEIHCNDLWRDGESRESILALLHGWGYTLRDYAGEEVSTLDDCSMTRVVCHP